jgi:hypothetical protein
MKTKTLHRKSASIAKGRWAAYATAGAASAFTCAHSAEATIHHSGPINRLFDECVETATYRLDRRGDFIRLRHSSLSCGGGYPGYAYFNVGGLVKASIAGFYSGCSFGSISASKLTRGQFISNRPFVPAPQNWAILGKEGLCGGGQFNGNGIGFIGFKFNNGSGDQYGWVRIQTREDSHHPFILRDYAYGDVGDRIRAGQTSSTEMVPEESNDTVPQEGSLGALALGAAGLLAWRKRRSRKL